LETVVLLWLRADHAGDRGCRMLACAAAILAIETRNGEHDT
jgi:hypothetical protein